MGRWTLIDLFSAFVLPLVPAVLLYELFSSENSAAYDKAGVKLGGPAALYVVLLMLALRYISRWRTLSDPFEKLKAVLVGEWDVEAVSLGSGRVLTSKATFDVDDDGLRLNGGSFKEAGRVVGTWSSDRPILDRNHDGVIYLYELSDVNSNDAWRGLMKLTLKRTQTPICMEGTWEVIGPEYHRGTATFSKRADQA